MMRRSLWILTCCLWTLIQACAGGGNGSVSSQIVAFPSQGKMLHGYLYVPPGSGPFPAMVYNHGSGTNEAEPVDLAQFYTDHGYVFFAPNRAGQGLSQDAGTPIIDRMNALSSQGLDGPSLQAAKIALHEEANLDVVAGIDWLKTQSFVDENNIAVTGVSFGGIQTLLTAEKGLGLRAALAFAPGAMSWEGTYPYLAQRLSTAVQTAAIPIFIFQAENDYSLGPSQVLGPQLQSKGFPNGYKDYPPFGISNQDGHGKFAVSAAGIDVWSPDALAFLQECGLP